MQLVNGSSSDEDEEDELEKAFVESSMGGKQDEKRVEKILKGAGMTPTNGEEEIVEDLNDESEETKIEV